MFQKKSGVDLPRPAPLQSAGSVPVRDGTNGAWWLTQTAADGRQVLKDGSCLLLRLDTHIGPAVCKIARRNNDRLHQEVERLEALRLTQPRLGARLPRILDHGTLNGGLYAGHAYYVMDLLPGPTLSGLLRSPSPDLVGARIDPLLRHVGGTLVDLLEEHRPDPYTAAPLGAWYLEQFTAADCRLADVSLVGPLLDRDDLVVNGVRRRSVRACLKTVLSPARQAALDALPPQVATVGHWNFHGENIILTPSTGPVPAFRVIDPDVKIAACDPVFGIARLLYTFPHDTMECDRYRISSDTMLSDWPDCRGLDVAVTWPEETAETYGRLFGGLTAPAAASAAPLDPRLDIETQDERLLGTRLDLALALCMLKGAALNQEPDIRYPTGRLEGACNNGLFLYLQALDFLNRLADRIEA